MVKTITYWNTLINLAKEVGEARKSNDSVRIENAEKKLKEYEQLVLDSDEMIIGHVS